MIDFVKAAKLGINAHEKSEREKVQISKTLTELRKQLRTHFGERLEIGIETRSKKSNPTLAHKHSIDRFIFESFSPTTLPTSYRKKMAQMSESNIEIPYSALVIRWGSSEEWELCRFDQEGSGFPVRLRYESKDVTCRDVRTFETALADVLESETSGQALASIAAKSGEVEKSTQEDAPQEDEDLI